MKAAIDLNYYFIAIIKKLDSNINKIKTLYGDFPDPDIPVEVGWISMNELLGSHNTNIQNCNKKSNHYINYIFSAYAIFILITFFNKDSHFRQNNNSQIQKAKISFFRNVNSKNRYLGGETLNKKVTWSKLLDSTQINSFINKSVIATDLHIDKILAGISSLKTKENIFQEDDSGFLKNIDITKHSKKYKLLAIKNNIYKDEYNRIQNNLNDIEISIDKSTAPLYYDSNQIKLRLKTDLNNLNKVNIINKKQENKITNSRYSNLVKRLNVGLQLSLPLSYHNPHYFLSVDQKNGVYRLLTPQIVVNYNLKNGNKLFALLNLADDQANINKVISTVNVQASQNDTSLVKQSLTLLKSAGFTFGLNYSKIINKNLVFSLGFNNKFQNTALLNKKSINITTGKILSDSLMTIQKKDLNREFVSLNVFDINPQISYKIKNFDIGVSTRLPISSFSSKVKAKELTGLIFLRYYFKKN